MRILCGTAEPPAKPAQISTEKLAEIPQVIIEIVRSRSGSAIQVIIACQALA